MTREHTQAVEARIETQPRWARGKFKGADAESSSEWDTAVEQLLAPVYRDPLAIADAVKAYAAFAVDSTRRQHPFEAMPHG